MYFVGKNGQQSGPYSIEMLLNFVSNQQLLREDLVWAEPMPTWMPAGTVPALFPAPMFVAPVIAAPMVPREPEQENVRAETNFPSTAYGSTRSSSKSAYSPSPEQPAKSGNSKFVVIAVLGLISFGIRHHFSQNAIDAQEKRNAVIMKHNEEVMKQNAISQQNAAKHAERFMAERGNAFVERMLEKQHQEDAKGGQ
jgi:hypothetical protein